MNWIVLFLVFGIILISISGWIAAVKKTIRQAFGLAE